MSSHCQFSVNMFATDEHKKSQTHLLLSPATDKHKKSATHLDKKYKHKKSATHPDIVNIHCIVMWATDKHKKSQTHPDIVMWATDKHKKSQTQLSNLGTIWHVRLTSTRNHVTVNMYFLSTTPNLIESKQ